MIDEREADKTEAKDNLQQISANISQQMCDLEVKLTEKLSTQINDQLDESTAKVNELDARISQVEEKHLELEENPPPT